MQDKLVRATGATREIARVAIRVQVPKFHIKHLLAEISGSADTPKNVPGFPLFLFSLSSAISAISATFQVCPLWTIQTSARTSAQALETSAKGIETVSVVFSCFMSINLSSENDTGCAIENANDRAASRLIGRIIAFKNTGLIGVVFQLTINQPTYRFARMYRGAWAYIKMGHPCPFSRTARCRQHNGCRGGLALFHHVAPRTESFISTAMLASRSATSMICRASCSASSTS